MCEFSFLVEQISSPTWLSSFSAAILMLGSIVPLRACIMRLGSMSVHGFLFSRFHCHINMPSACCSFVIDLPKRYEDHFGSDPQTRLSVSTLKCLWKGFIAEYCHDHRFFLLKWADLRTVAKIAKLNVKPSTFTTLTFFFADTRARGNFTAT